MSTSSTYFPKRLITGIITLAILSLLIWQYFHGGVPAHHLLDKKEMPAISNWWGALLLPVLTWILLGRIEKRLQQQPGGDQKKKITGLFALGLLLGILIVIAFTQNYTPVLDNVPYLLLGLSLLVPVYYAEFMLGFVLAMTYSFGAILPMAFILIIAAIGYLLYRFVRPLLLNLGKYFRKKQS